MEYGFTRKRRAGCKGTAVERVINPARHQTGAKRELLNAWERIVTRESSELKKKRKKKKSHILPSKLGHIPDGVSHRAELSWEGGFRAERTA